MENKAYSPRVREPATRKDGKHQSAELALTRPDERHPAPDREAFSAKLALSRSFVAAPTD